MHLLQSNDDWPTYAYHKCLGPFESLEIANQVEEYCINASTNEDTDDMCNKALSQNNTEKKRKRKKPTYLSDTSDEDEVITDKSDTDKCIDTSSFLLPPSRYQLQNVNESILSPANAKSTHEAIRGSVDIMESNMLGSKRPTTEGSEESNETVENSSSQELSFSHSISEEENIGTATIITSQKQNKCYPGKKISVVKVRNVNRTTNNLPGPSKQCRTGNMTFVNADLEADSNPVPARNAKDNQVQEPNYTRHVNADVGIDVNPARNSKNHSANCQGCNQTPLSEPMTDKRFQTYYKCLKNKLNHVINLLQDRGIELEKEGENLLPNFPLKTGLEFEQFEINLIESSEIQKRYIREIKMIGGSDASKFTRATLRFLMSHELALQYS